VLSLFQKTPGFSFRDDLIPAFRGVSTPIAEQTPAFRGGIIMAYIDRLSSPVPLQKSGSKTDSSGKDHTLNYLFGFAAFGLFFSIMATALTPPELLQDPVAFELIPSGLDVAKIEIPLGLAMADHASYD
jgi:hypothetical protein